MMRPDTGAARLAFTAAIFRRCSRPADALLHGEAVFHTVVHGGFASVRNDVIRVITDSAVDTEEKSDTENED